MPVCFARGLNLSLKSRNLSTKKIIYIPSRARSTAKQAHAAQGHKPLVSSQVALSWPEYLAIRRSKRHWQTATTIPCALLGLAGGLLYFGTRDADPLKPIMGIDPFFFYGFCTVGCLGAGAIVGPTIGTALWRARHRSITQAIDVKDTEFFHRIAKNRVDASLQSPTQPVPDYYGEKIGSLHQYRQWLRDQAKYKRKALLPEEL